jgi:branched-chain amino acid transport system ATP-binding protein
MLEVSGIGISFGGLAALKDISFSVEPGQVLSVIGPNGAGKTTLFNIVTGFLKPTTGHVAYEGRKITGLPPNRIARGGIVRTFQKTEVFPELTVAACVRAGFLCHQPFSVWDVMLRWRKTSDFTVRSTREAGELLDFVGLADKADSLAAGLSYGEQRLLEVAVGLAAQPRLILLDEPASGMNIEESERMIELISRLRKRGLTVVLVEHNMSVVMGISDRIVVLNYGQKIADGDPDQIADDPEVISAYLGQGWKDAAA